MIIQDSSILLSSQHHRVEKREQEEHFRFWVGNAPAQQGNGDISRAHALRVSLSQAALEMGKGAATTMETTDDPLEAASHEDRLKISLLERFIEMLTGKKVNIQCLCDVPAADSAHSADESFADRPQMAGWGLEYDYYERYEEREHTTFSARGIVHTADGKEISINVDLSMSRTFIEENRISIRAGDAALIDPLVINFNGLAAELTTTRFHFDLDADGTDNLIPFLKPGSGFLALDRNGDGFINDGSELFGPVTGNGFAELARYDEDKNGWIDRNDAIYDKLRVWTKDADGNDRLFALGSLGIGAIYLGSASTPFGLKTAQNESLGQIARTGVYLNTNGTAGTIQHVDLAV